MSALEILFVLGGLVYEVFFVAYAILMFRSGTPDPTIIAPFALAIILGLTVVILTMRDLAIRDFVSDKPESDHVRMKWYFLIPSTFGIGLIVYLLRHGFRPRRGGSESQPKRPAESETPIR